MTKEEAAEWCESVHAVVNMNERVTLGYAPWVSVRVRNTYLDGLDLYTIGPTFVRAVLQLKAAYDAMMAERERQQIEYQQQIDDEREQRRRERAEKNDQRTA